MAPDERPSHRSEAQQTALEQAFDSSPLFSALHQTCRANVATAVFRALAFGPMEYEPRPKQSHQRAVVVTGLLLATTILLVAANAVSGQHLLVLLGASTAPFALASLWYQAGSAYNDGWLERDRERP